MKKILVSAILGLAATASVMAQGRILLNSSSSTTAPYPYITYGAGAGGSGNIASGQGFTVGFYFSTVLATFNDPSGIAIPGGTFSLATGSGSTALFDADYPGLFNSGGAEYTFDATATIYMVVVAYNTSSYATASVRGHSAVFTISPNQALGTGTQIGADAGRGNMLPFQVLPVPEPSTFALAGLGLAGLLIFRRRN